MSQMNGQNLNLHTQLPSLSMGSRWNSTLRTCGLMARVGFKEFLFGEMGDASPASIGCAGRNPTNR